MPVGASPGFRVCLPGDRFSRTLKALSAWRERSQVNRHRRVFVLLIAAWLVNLFDLGFTLLAHQQQIITELNPLANRVMQWGASAVILYKLLLISAGSAVLWWQRRRMSSEIALWGYGLLCLWLAVHWHGVYHSAEPVMLETAAVRETIPDGAYFSVYSFSTRDTSLMQLQKARRDVSKQTVTPASTQCLMNPAS